MNQFMPGRLEDDRIKQFKKIETNQKINDYYSRYAISKDYSATPDSRYFPGRIDSYSITPVLNQDILINTIETGTHISSPDKI